MTTLATFPAVYTTLHQAIQGAKSIFVTAHVNPDGDTLGSMLGLKHALLPHFPHIERFDCVISGKRPDVYAFVPGMEDVLSIEQAEHLLLTEYDLGISVDCGALSRLGLAQPYFANAKTTVNIDHHVSNDAFADINVIETDAAASGQVVTNLLDAWGVPFNAAMAVAIYVALITDTGGFRYPATTPAVFRLAARLQEAGCDTSMVYKKVFEELPRAQVLLHAHCLLASQHNAAATLYWSEVPQTLLKQLGALEEHIEGLIDHLRQTQGAMAAAVFKEAADGTVKVSLRSNVDSIDVSALLAPLGGGGHKKAAGASLAMGLAAAKAVVLPLLEAAVLA